MDKNQTEEVIPLKNVQNWLRDNNIDGLLVRSTDRYFNEYVPKSMSMRYRLSGFDGSMGDTIITQGDAYLFVDGRYALQAKEQAKEFAIHVTRPSQSIENLWLSMLATLIEKNSTLLVDPSTVDMALFEKIDQKAQTQRITLDYHFEKFAKEIKLITDGKQKSAAFIVPENIAGANIDHKILMIRSWLIEQKISGLLLTKLDDIAWVTNIRSYYFPYQSSLPGIAAVFLDHVVLGVNANLHESNIRLPSFIKIVTEQEFFMAVNLAISKGSLGVDKLELSKAHQLSLHKADIEIKAIENPVAILKAKKNEKELFHLRSAFKKADKAVFETHCYVEQCFEENTSLSEIDVDNYIRKAFASSNAEALSFRPICASEENGAIIHYGHPKDSKVLAQNSLFLLDTGAYYQGYATDLTRTFLADKKNSTAKDWQKQMFTLVLKASIAGLSARIRKGSVGMQLDAIVRAPLWQAGFDYAHGTGHGIGINVHEFPPRIGPASNTELLEGYVFSIEPGLYLEGLGGVRIENLVTLVNDLEHNDFLRVLPLTFCPLDERLIDHGLLDAHEEQFLSYFKQEWESQLNWPNLPPLRSFSFRI